MVGTATAHTGRERELAKERQHAKDGVVHTEKLSPSLVSLAGLFHLKPAEHGLYVMPSVTPAKGT